jgi:hypothetical protein
MRRGRDRSWIDEDAAESVRESTTSPSHDLRPATSTAATSSIMMLQRSAGNRAVANLMTGQQSQLTARRPIDVLTTEEGNDGTGGSFLDAVDGGVTAAAAGGGVATAVPTNFQQILTSWAPGPTKYGFQLKFRCSSSSGLVSDLQAQAPNLSWREYVTYSRNDFAHRINPPNPTILPSGPGVSFAPGSTTVVSPNVIEFNGVTDTHWMPTSAVRDTDYPPAGTHALPAVMESSQVYQYSTDDSTWTPFAGPFTLRRELAPAVGPSQPGQTMPLFFTTTKYGVHMTTEAYKP